MQVYQHIAPTESLMGHCTSTKRVHTLVRYSYIGACLVVARRSCIITHAAKANRKRFLMYNCNEIRNKIVHIILKCDGDTTVHLSKLPLFLDVIAETSFATRKCRHAWIFSCVTFFTGVFF